MERTHVRCYEVHGEVVLSGNDSVQSEYPHAKSAKDAKGIGNADFKNNSLKNGVSARLRSMFFAFPLRPSRALRELSSASFRLRVQGEERFGYSPHAPNKIIPLTGASNPLRLSGQLLRGFGAGMDVELVVNGANMGANGAHADRELIGDFFVHVAFGQQFQNFLFAAG